MIDGIYEIWKNKNASTIACANYEFTDTRDNQTFLGERRCIESVSVSTPSLGSVDTDEHGKYCTKCQRDFWNSFDRRPGYAPHLYYWSFGNQEEYLRKIYKVCGSLFFDGVEEVL